jgi:hypothetical protein
MGKIEPVTDEMVKAALRSWFPDYDTEPSLERRHFEDMRAALAAARAVEQETQNEH